MADGDELRLSTRRGSAVLRARVTDRIRSDTVFVPFHWPGVNTLTSARLDPISRMPEFKTCAVAVTAADAPDLVDLPVAAGDPPDPVDLPAATAGARS